MIHIQDEAKKPRRFALPIQPLQILKNGSLNGPDLEVLSVLDDNVRLVLMCGVCVSVSFALVHAREGHA